MISAIRLLRVLALPLALVAMMAFGSVQSFSCDMHGLGAMRTESAQSTAGHGAHTAHDAARHGHGPARDSGRSDDCCCTCIGDCTAPAQTATVPAPPTLRVALVVAEPHRLPDAQPAESPPTEPDRLLPFANGPPTVG